MSAWAGVIPLRQTTRNGFAFLTIVLCLGVVIGCGGGGGSSTKPTTPTTPTTPTQTGPASGSEFLYALGGTGPVSGGVGEIYVSSLSPATGQLSEPVDATPSNLPASLFEQLPPVAVGKYLYAPGYESRYAANAVFPYSVTGTQGQLAAHPNYPLDFSGVA